MIARYIFNKKEGLQNRYRNNTLPSYTNINGTFLKETLKLRLVWQQFPCVRKLLIKLFISNRTFELGQSFYTQECFGKMARPVLCTET